MACRFGDQRGNLGVIRHVSWHDQNPFATADLGNSAFELLRVAASNNDLGAFAQEQLSRCQAHAAAAPGDEGDFIVQLAHDELPNSNCFIDLL